MSFRSGLGDIRYHCLLDSRLQSLDNFSRSNVEELARGVYEGLVSWSVSLAHAIQIGVMGSPVWLKGSVLVPGEPLGSYGELRRDSSIESVYLCVQNEWPRRASGRGTGLANHQPRFSLSESLMACDPLDATITFRPM